MLNLLTTVILASPKKTSNSASSQEFYCLHTIEQKGLRHAERPEGAHDNRGQAEQKSWLSGYAIGSRQSSKIFPRLSEHYARRQPVQTGKNILKAHIYLAQTCTPHPVGASQGVLFVS